MMQESYDFELLGQGAEAKIYTSQFCGRCAVIKERFVKTYRLQELDEKLSQKRIKQEVRFYMRARKAGIDTPCLYMFDLKSRQIYVEYIEGGTVKSWLMNNRGEKPTESLEIARKIGLLISKLHNSNMVHGDMTTSNMLIRPDDQSIVLIDFGLSSLTDSIEDKAVDLYVMEKAFIASHENADALIDEVLRVYKAECSKSDRILQRLAQVRLRGRKKSMVG